tara:strand:- start:169 stop:1092 length:924 start_codon:yes stop_codon:yes gene_type:complete
MKKIFISFFFIIIFSNVNHAETKEVKILRKIGNQIITNIDIENEYKYLISLNKEYQKLEKEQIFNFAKSSLFREKIKESELKKYFDLGVQDSFLNSKISEIYKNLGFANSEDFQKYLDQFDLRIKDVVKKIEIELKWNKLIYDKYKDQLVINEKALKKKIIDDTRNKDTFNLSELIFSYKTEQENKEKLAEIIKSINEIGFENTVLIFSESETRKNSGNLGWVSELSLSKTILKKLEKVNVSEITEPIQLQNAILILKLNDKKKIQMSSINVDEELTKLIKFETNKQLNTFSKIFFEKIRVKLNINE